MCVPNNSLDLLTQSRKQTAFSPNMNQTPTQKVVLLPGQSASSRVALSTLFGGLLAGLMFMSIGISAAPPGTSDEIRERIAPVGSICRAGDECGAATASAPAGPRDGKAVYEGFCSVCHASGISGAPIYADKAAWAPRIDKGVDALWQTMQNGLGAMPAKGTCVNCSDEELQASLDYMIEGVN